MMTEGMTTTMTADTMTTTTIMATTTNPTEEYRPFPFGALLSWHAHHRRDHLPWRDFAARSDDDIAYRVWVSEIFLQQTQAERVIGYFERVLAAYPTVAHLARASYEEFFEHYRGLGYYSRARNMLAAARKVTDEHGGRFPRDTAGLRALPGVGPYTAEAVRAFAYDLPTLAMDTNLERVFARYYSGSREVPVSRGLVATLTAQMERERLSGRAVNAALMDLGAATAVRSAMDFDNYPLPGCRYAETRGALEPVAERVRRVFPLADATRVVMLHRDHSVYLSADPDAYSPFVLPPLPGDFRAGVQEYFERTYGLAVSVRPVRWRGYRGGAPYALANAQVQTGTHAFAEYGTDDRRAWETAFFGACDSE